MCDNASWSRNEPSHRDIEALFLRDVKTILASDLFLLVIKTSTTAEAHLNKKKKKKTQQTIQQEKCHIPVYTLIHCTFE